MNEKIGGVVGLLNGEVDFEQEMVELIMDDDNADIDSKGVLIRRKLDFINKGVGQLPKYVNKVHERCVKNRKK